MSAPTLTAAERTPANDGHDSRDATAGSPATLPAQGASRRAPGRASWWRWAAWDVTAWGVVALLFAVQATARTSQPFGQAMVEQVAGFIPCALFTPLIAWVSLRWRITDEEGRARALLAHALCAACFVTVGGMMMGALEWLVPFHDRGDGLLAAVRAAAGRYFAIDVLIYVMVAAAVLALAYAGESRERTVRAARLQAQLAHAQLHALGAQLQPHFLFNTLHVISALVRHDPKRAEQLIARLSELLRQMLDSGDRVEVPLGEELAFLEKYVDIQEARFGPRLQVTFAVEPSMLDVQVPRLVLQPLVENAVRHGIAPRAAGGVVEVRASCEGGWLTLVVRDDGAGLPGGAVRREGVGLSSTRARLAQLYGDAGALTVEPGPGGTGTVCTVRIPCRKGTAAATAAPRSYATDGGDE